MEYIKIDYKIFEEKIVPRMVDILKKGGIIALPTETVYGLVADAFNEEAVQKIYRIKGRAPEKPLPIFISNIKDVCRYVEELPDSAHKIMEAFWPGPLTIILSKKEGLKFPFQNTTLGFRIPQHPVPLAILKVYGILVSTSANVSGGKETVSAEEVKEIFGDSIDLILDGGSTKLQEPSTVVDCTGSLPKIVREGKIKSEDIEKIINM